MLNKIQKNVFFDSVGIEINSNSKPFWSKCKQYFSYRHSKCDPDIFSTENDEILIENKKVADAFNFLFQTVT